ncbi:MAG: 50S ribosomal protein L29 [Candidatus Levyibacteriota bacterium]
MKTKAKKELHTKTIPELKARFLELKNELFQLKLDKFQKKLKNLRSVFEKRKEVARILTILEEKKLEVSLKK